MKQRIFTAIAAATFLLTSCYGNIVNERSRINRRDAALDTGAYVEPEHVLRVFTWERDYDGNRWTTELVKGEEIEVGPLIKYDENEKLYTAGVIDNDVWGTYLCTEFDGPIRLQMQNNLYDGMVWRCKAQNYQLVEKADLGSYFVDGSNRLECIVYNSVLGTVLLEQDAKNSFGYGDFRKTPYYKDYITEQKLADLYDDVPDYLNDVWRGIVLVYLDIISYDTKDMSESAKMVVLLRFYSHWRTDQSAMLDAEIYDKIYEITGEKRILQGLWTAELVDYWQVETGE